MYAMAGIQCITPQTVKVKLYYSVPKPVNIVKY